MEKAQRIKLIWIIACTIAPLVILFIILTSGDEKRSEVTWPTEGRPVKLITVQPENGALTRAFPGIAEPALEVQLAFRVEGPLCDLPVDVGQYVKKGDLIAQIDPRDFEVRLATLKAEHASLKAQLVNAELRYTRYQDLYKTDATAKASLDSAQADHDQLAAQVTSVAAQLRDARNRLADTSLKAPFDGYVDSKFVENFDNVQAKQPIVLFLDCATIEVTAGVPEELIADGITLKTFFCEFDTYPGKRFPASLKELGRKPRADNQSYPLTVALSCPDEVLPQPGMAATLFVEIQSKDAPGFVLPNPAIVNDEDRRSFVWVYDRERGTVERSYVRTGQVVHDGIEVLEGVEAGEQIVAAGAHYLQPGQKVTPAQENWRALQDRSAETSKP